MQKEKILSELYHGNLNPVAKSVVQGSEYQKCQHEVAALEEELLCMLEEQTKKKFQAFVTAQGKLNAISGEERFTDGFRMGAKMILEIFENDGEQFKPITG
ncbi:DUF6809 family protein [Anaerotignum sp.]|uniref:DUF6809 family protein n=1 Tax=Anaerotignum sp. TaxID=2039241 RepID=UPI0028997D9A|nr:DUF6809 family protein [Anaerotignum sp.]